MVEPAAEAHRERTSPEQLDELFTAICTELNFAESCIQAELNTARIGTERDICVAEQITATRNAFQSLAAEIGVAFGAIAEKAAGRAAAAEELEFGSKLGDLLEELLAGSEEFQLGLRAAQRVVTSSERCEQLRKQREASPGSGSDQLRQAEEARGAAAAELRAHGVVSLGKQVSDLEKLWSVIADPASGELRQAVGTILEDCTEALHEATRSLAVTITESYRTRNDRVIEEAGVLRRFLFESRK